MENSTSFVRGGIAEQRRKKVVLAIFAPLLALVILLTATLSTQKGLTASGDAWDLSNFVTSVSVKDSSGTAVTDGNYIYDAQYTFSISFAERLGAGGQFGYNASGRLVYQLPSQLEVPPAMAVTNGIVRLSNGQPVGHYTIDATGRVEVWFDKVDNTGAAIAQNFIDYYTDASFKLDVNAQFKEGTEAGKIIFGADAVITINTITSPPAGLTISKKASNFNSANETVDFTVSITGTGSTVNTIVLGDVMTIAGNNVPSNTAISDNSAYSSGLFTGVQYRVVTASPASTGAWTPASFTYANNAWQIAFPSTVSLDPGDRIELQYTVNLENVLDYLSTQPASGAKWIQRIDYNLNLNNAATATGKDKNSKDVSGKATTQTPMQKSFLSKSGSLSSDSSRITWTASAGDGKTPLNGSTITDVLQNNQILDGDVTVRVWGTPPNSSGTWGSPTVTLTAASAGVSITAGANGGFSLDIPTSGLGSVSTVYRVDFVYKTMLASGGFTSTSTSYTNRIDIKVNGSTSSKTGSVSGATPASNATAKLNKTSEWVADADGNPQAIKYTLIMTVPAGNQGNVLYIEDDLYSYNASGMYDYLRPRIENLTVTINPDEPNFVYRAVLLGPARAAGGQDVDFYFADSATRNPADAKITSTWPYSDEKTITITYTESVDTTIYSNGTATTLRTLLTANKDNYIQNNVSVHTSATDNSAYIPGTYKSVNDAWPIFKSGTPSATDPSVFDYEVELNYNSDARYALFSQGPAIFEDTFDPRMEYVPNSLYVVVDPNVTGPIYVPYEPYGTAFSGRPTGLLPELTEVTGNTISVDLSTMNQGNTNSSRILPFAQVYTPTDPLWYTQAKYMKVCYQLRLKAEYAGYAQEDNPAALSLSNTATVHATGTHYKSNFSNGTTVTFTPPKVVTKDMAQSSNDPNIAIATIIINPLGQRLRPASVDDPRFTATDVMNDTLAFYLNSIKIYTQDASGNWKTTPETPASDGLWSVSADSQQKVNFQLIDETPIKIVYEAQIIPLAGQPYRNEISVYGESDVWQADRFVTQGSSAIGMGSMMPLSLFKEDEDTGELLAGATFKLYVAIPGYGFWGGTSDSILATDSVEPIPGKVFYAVCDGTYGSVSGTYKFANNVISASHNAVYLIREVTPPPNHVLPANPYAYIALTSANQTAWQAELGPLANVRLLADNIHITNKSNLTSIVLNGTKNADVPDDFDGSATFTYELTQVGNEAGDPLADPASAVLKAPLYSAVSVYPGHYAGQGFTFPKIDGLADDVYFFKIEEADVPVGWLRLTDPQIVKVQVTDSVATAYYPGEMSAAVFENKYKNPAAHLANILIPVKKVIAGDSYGSAPTFTFQIEQVDADGALISPSSYIDSNNSMVTITGEGMNNFVLQDLIAPADNSTVNSYYFKVGEVLNGSGGWSYDENLHTIRVDVTYDADLGGVAKLVALDGAESDAGIVANFTNSYHGGPILPESGGIGTAILYAIATILTLGLAAFFVIRCKRNLLGGTAS